MLVSFEPQNDLERFLVMATADPAHRPQFYKELAQSNIFIVQHGETPATREEKVLTEDDTIQIQHIQFNDQLYIPIFSSLTRLQAILDHDVAYLEMNTIEFMKMTFGTPLILNPGSEYGKEFHPEETASIIDGSIWENAEKYTVEEETQVMIGQPANYPDELVAALSRFFETKTQVRRAWLAHFYNPEDGLPPHTLVAVEITGDIDEVFSEAAVVTQNVNVPDMPVDFLPLTGRGGLEGYFLEEAEPFYQQRS